jgi:hypothetical protein
MVAVERPFFVTLVFPELDDPDFPGALELARQSPDFVRGADARYRAGFRIADAVRLRDVFAVVGRSPDTDVLIEDQEVPYGRELWMPLVSLFMTA